LTLFMGWFSQIEHPVVRHFSIATWKLFSDLDLSEARKTRFASLHDCFVRELKPGARPIDEAPDVLVSPCDGIVMASGSVLGTELVQAKDMTYTLEDLLVDPELVETYRNGRYVTLRLRSTMYHRFHAPSDCQVDGVTYVSGDTWNVNPIAVSRIERLYCKNERVVMTLKLQGSTESLTLVPVAAILVASIRLNFIDVALDLRYKGPNRIPCRASFRKGDEMGHFRHGSTIIAFATRGLELCDRVREGRLIRMGEPLFVHR
jgi:phosphatidylserine decarboxylase